MIPPRYFTFDETGERATLHLEWHGMRFSRTARLERMRSDLRMMAPELLPFFESSYEQVKDCFRPDAQPLTAAEAEEAERGL